MTGPTRAVAPRRGGWAILLPLLAACFGDDPPTGPDWPLGEHRFLHGLQLMADGTPAVDYGVVVLGRTGGMVTAQGPDSQGRYVALVDGLTPPYMVWGSTGLSAIALDTGEATVSLLTHLQAGELLRADPGNFFGAVSDQVDIPAFDQFTPAALAAANTLLQFDNTQLGAVNADSTVSGTSFASLTLSFPSQVLDLGDAGFPPPPDCAGLDSVRVSYSDTTPAMAICPPAFDSTVGTVWVGSYQQADGEPGYFVQDANFDNIAVNLQGTAIREVLVSTGGTNGMAGGCAGTDCAGVTVSAPDSLGEVTISFAGTLLREAAPGVKLTTLRTLSLSGTVGRFPPVPGPVPPALRRRARQGRAGPR